MKALILATALIGLSMADTPQTTSNIYGQSLVAQAPVQVAQWGSSVCSTYTTCFNQWGQSYQVSCYVTGAGCTFSAQYGVGVSCTGYGPQGWQTYWAHC